MLKSCPFCGGATAFKQYSHTEKNAGDMMPPVVECEKCGALVSFDVPFAGALESEAMEEFNRRFERTCRNVGGEEWGFKCSECGGYTHGSPFHIPDAERDRLAEEISKVMGVENGRIISAHSAEPRFCPMCGARVVVR